VTDTARPAARASPAASTGPAGGVPATGTDTATRLALIVAAVGLLLPGTPPPVAVLSLIGVVATLLASMRWRTGRLVIIVLLVVGIALRLAPSSGFSDVLMVTEAATREMLAGGSPYGHAYAESVPPGAPFAYGPLALLWYLPSLDDPGTMELLASCLVLVALAVRGGPVSLAIYAVTPAFVVAATDGSNDTTAGLLILVALLVAVRAPLSGAVLLAVATAFKPYALAWLPGLIAYAGSVTPLLAFAAASAAAWLLPSLAWGPEALLWSFRRADAIHPQPYYSLAYALGGADAVPKAGWQAIRVAAGVLAAVLGLWLVRSVASLVIAGSIVYCATLFLGWWSTFAYVAALAPLLCWYLDGWLGLAGQRVIWPGDPVRSVTTWVDSRWPVRHPGRHVTEASGWAR